MKLIHADHLVTKYWYWVSLPSISMSQVRVDLGRVFADNTEQTEQEQRLTTRTTPCRTSNNETYGSRTTSSNFQIINIDMCTTKRREKQKISVQKGYTVYCTIFTWKKQKLTMLWNLYFSSKFLHWINHFFLQIPPSLLLFLFHVKAYTW